MLILVCFFNVVEEEFFHEMDYFCADEFMLADRHHQDGVHAGTVTTKNIGKELVTHNRYLVRL